MINPEDQEPSILGWIILAVVCLSAIFSATALFSTLQTNSSESQFSSCVARQQQQLITALEAREGSVEASQDAVYVLIQSIPKDKTPAEFTNALNQYLSVQQQLNSARPNLPAPTYQACSQ